MKAIKAVKTQTPAKPSHTPGPQWRIEKTSAATAALLKWAGQNDIASAEGEIEIWSAGEIIAVVRTQKDARLIAAAPDQNKALAAVVRADRLLEVTKMGHYIVRLSEAEYEAARAAILRATEAK